MGRRVQNVSLDAYEWGRREIERRDCDIAACRDFDDYEAMKRRWDGRQAEAGISNHVRRQVLRAAADERRDFADMPWLRNVA